MSKHAFDKIMEGLVQVEAIEAGTADPSTYRVHVPERIDVKAIRKAQGLSQDVFAARFGLPVATVRDWEQNRRQPDTGSKLFLKVLAKDPAAVIRALAE